MDKVENVDLSGLVLGRAASVIAQKLLLGYKINAYNAENMVITGSLNDILAKYREKLNYAGKGDPEHGPKYARLPHFIFKRTVRNMVPHKKATGREALKNLKVYIGNEDNLKLISYDDAQLRRGLKFRKLGEVSKLLGANF